MKVPDLSKQTLFAAYGPASYYDLLLKNMYFSLTILVSQTFTIPSESQLATKSPFNENLTLLTEFKCPYSVETHNPDLISQKLIY